MPTRLLGRPKTKSHSCLESRFGLYHDRDQTCPSQSKATHDPAPSLLITYKITIYLYYYYWSVHESVFMCERVGERERRKTVLLYILRKNDKKEEKKKKKEETERERERKG